MSAAGVWLLAGAAWAGAMAGRRAGGVGAQDGVVLLFAVVVAAAALLLVAIAARSGCLADAGRLVVVAVSLSLVVACGAGLRTHHIRSGPLASMVAELAEDGGRVVRLSGRLATDPAATGSGAVGSGAVGSGAAGSGATGSGAVGSGAWSAILSLDHVSPVGTGDPRGDPAPTWTTGERVMLRADGAAPEVGARVVLTGLAEPVSSAAAAWLASLGVVTTVTAVELAVAGPAAPPVRLTTQLRGRLRAIVTPALPPAEGSLLTGLVTGDVSGQPDDVADAFKAAGLSHLVAVSGSNVAAVIAGSLALLLGVGMPRRWALQTALGLVWWFVVLVRAEPSVVRAALMATLVIGAMLVGHLRDPLHLLGTAVVLALLIDPLLVGRLGFALSVAATLGVLTVGRWLVYRLRGPRWLRQVVGATVGAQVAVAPLLLLGGLPVGMAGLPANLVAVPPAGVASAGGAAVAVLSVVNPWLAGALAGLLRPFLAVVIWSATTFAGPTGVMVDRVGRWLVAGMMLGTLVWASVRLARGRGLAVRRRLGVVWLVAVVVAAARTLGPLAAPTVPDAPVLVVLDVGQGDALLVSDPQAGWMLVDGGPDPAVLRAGLRRHGVTRLAAVVISHPHADHDAGLAGLVGWMPVEALLVGPPAGDPPVSPVVAEAESAGIVVHTLSAGSTWRLGTTAVRVLSPPPTGIGNDANESSVVLRLEPPGGRSVLLGGDAEVIAQTRLLSIDPVGIDVDILKVPHHGGDTNAEGFLAATTPDLAIISAGEGNRFGHPHPDVLADLVGIEVRRTDQDGDVVVPLSRSP